MEIKNGSELFTAHLTSNQNIELLSNRVYQINLYGYVIPTLVTVTTALNSLVIIILTRPSMRSSNSVVLSALAISDTLTGLITLPFYLYMYTFGLWTQHIPYRWCFIHKICIDVLPTIFHTISVWLTLTLAIQRYIYLCHPMAAKGLCGVGRMRKVVMLVALLSFLFHSLTFFDTTFVPVPMKMTTEGCSEVFSQWAERSKHIYIPMYYWVRVLIIHLIPAVSLVILNSILIGVMKAATRRRRLLLIQNLNNEWRRVRETNITTCLLIVVIGLFLVVEIPMAIIMTVSLIQSEIREKILSDETQDFLTSLFKMLILTSYPLNFFIYVGMSKKFRSQAMGICGGHDTNCEKTITTRDRSSSALCRSLLNMTPEKCKVAPLSPVRRLSLISDDYSFSFTNYWVNSLNGGNTDTIKVKRPAPRISRSSSEPDNSKLKCTCNCDKCKITCIMASDPISPYLADCL